VNIKDAKNLTPLHYACRANNHVKENRIKQCNRCTCIIENDSKIKNKESSRSAHPIQRGREWAR
jgi:ankyrin repeat protein